MHGNVFIVSDDKGRKYGFHACTNDEEDDQIAWSCYTCAQANRAALAMRYPSRLLIVHTIPVSGCFAPDPK